MMLLYLLLMTFLTNEVKAQQHWEKKRVNNKENYVEK